MFTKDTQQHSENSSNFGRWLLRLFWIVLFLIIIGAAVFFGYMYLKTRQELSFLSTPAGQQQLAERETEIVLAALGKLVILPDEDPVVATISDATLLATQSAFYKDSQNGDKLVVFPQAQRAFIYSPARNILINAGPLVIDQESAINENADTFSPDEPESEAAASPTAQPVDENAGDSLE